MTLFPTPAPKPSKRLAPRARSVRIPTGTPRLVESSSDRRTRASVEAWQAVLDAVRRSSAARLELLKGRAGNDRLPCAWKKLGGCDADCRCRGAGTVSIDFLRAHYERLAIEIALLVSPSPSRRSS